MLNLLNEEKNKNKKLLEELNKVKIKSKKINDIKSSEEIIAIFFTSVNQDIQRPISCKISDTFVKIEEKIYNEYPKYKDCNTYFTVNGKIIDRFKTIKENGIKDGNIIIANIYDE